MVPIKKTSFHFRVREPTEAERNKELGELSLIRFTCQSLFISGFYGQHMTLFRKHNAALSRSQCLFVLYDRGALRLVLAGCCFGKNGDVTESAFQPV